MASSVSDSTDNALLVPVYRAASLAPSGESITVEFYDSVYTFHAQWLYDAKCDQGAPRSFQTTFLHNQPLIKAKEIQYIPSKAHGTLNVIWIDDTVSQFPVPWLRTLAPLVAKEEHLPASDSIPTNDCSRGWNATTIQIPEINYQSLFSSESEADFNSNILRVLDVLLKDENPGIMKVINLPKVDLDCERDKDNTLVTRVLKRIFGSVFQHPRRGADKTFNVASHHEADTKRGQALPNYDTSQILLPHVDHAHYTYPVQVQGWYGLEGKSINTFISSVAVLETLKEETPELAPYLYDTPMSVGRIVHFYDPPLIQGTLDPAVTTEPGTSSKVKRIRWHSHLTGSLLAPYEKFNAARAAYHKFQEIMRRDTHQLEVELRPGDLYIWNNFRILHGRECVIEVPRTGVGQTVPEQTVQERYRTILYNRLVKSFDEKWLVHMPVPQMRAMVTLTDAPCTETGGRRGEL